MAQIFLVISTILFSIGLNNCSGTAHANGDKKPKCSIKNAVAGGAQVDVPVDISKGTAMLKTQKTNFEGIVVSVSYLLGDKYEPQTLFMMTMDDVTARLYDVTERTNLPSLSKGTYYLECSFQ